MSRQQVLRREPVSYRAMLLVPPPTSRLATATRRCLDRASAPAPRAERTDSRSGPAVATTKSPAMSDRAASTSLAFCFRAVSPVMITAPVWISLGLMPPAAYSRRTMSFTASASISVGDFRGVK